MRKDDCYQLGEVIKTHGLHGEVSISLDVDYPDEYTQLESVFLFQQEKLIPFFIDTIQIHHGKALVKFDEVNTIEDAKSLVKSRLYLPLSSLPKLAADQYYFHDLIDCQVVENEELIGTVSEVIDLNGNQLLQVIHDGQEILIPLKDEILTKVEVEEKRIEVKLPDGLMDIYKEDK